MGLLAPISSIVIGTSIVIGVANSGSAAPDDFLVPSGHQLRQDRARVLQENWLRDGFGDADFHARHRALWIVNSLGSGIVPELLRFVEASTDPIKIRMGLFALGALNDGASRYHIVNWLSKGEGLSDAKVAALWALGQFPPHESDIDTKIDLILLQYLNRRFASRSLDRIVRQVAALSLGQRRVAAAVPELSRLVDRSEEPDEKMRAACAIALGMIGDLAAVPALGTSLSRESSPLLLAASTWSLGLCGGHVAILNYLKKSPDLNSDLVGESVILALSLGRTSATQKALSSLAQTEESLRVESLYAASLAGGSALDLIESALVDGFASEDVLEAAILAAATSMVPSQFSTGILGRMKSGSVPVRRAAIAALAFLSKNSAWEPLQRLIGRTDQDDSFRLDALSALAIHGLEDSDLDFEALAETASEELSVALRNAALIREGRRDHRLLSLRHEGYLNQRLGRYSYRLSDLRNRLLVDALELDERVVDMGGGAPGRPRRPGSVPGDGVLDGGGASSGNTGGSGGSGGDGGGSNGSAGGIDSGPSGPSTSPNPGSGGESIPNTGQPNSGSTPGSIPKAGIRRDFQNGGRRRPQRLERVEHDLRLLLESGRWLPDRYPMEG